MVQKLANGFLVIFDGIDGVGKTTQLELAQKELEAEGWPVHVRRNLGGTPIGEALRQVMKSKVPRPSETNLYISAAIQEALLKDVAEGRQQGTLLLMDRGPLSLAAYEIYGSGLAEKLGRPFVDRGMSVLKPELTIVYEADIAKSLERSAGSDYFESKPLDYFARVAQGYKDDAHRYPNIKVIKADRSIEAIHEDTMQAIRAALNAHSAH